MNIDLRPAVTSRDALLRTPPAAHDRVLGALGKTMRELGFDMLEDNALLLTIVAGSLAELRNSQGPRHDPDYIEAPKATDAIDDALNAVRDALGNLEHAIKLHEADKAAHALEAA
jgi:hypothetical protein